MDPAPNHVNLSIDTLQKYCTHQKEQIIQLEQQNAELNAKVRWFEEQFRLNRHRQFGASSEQTTPEQQQLFNEAEVEAKPAPEPIFDEITYRRRKQAGKREEQLKDLPVEIIEYRLPPGDQTCSCIPWSRNIGMVRRCMHRQEQQWSLNYCNQLYAIERKLREVSSC
jgi:hypothetical protein